MCNRTGGSSPPPRTDVTTQNQGQNSSTTEHPKGVWSGVGPRVPEVGELVCVRLMSLGPAFVAPVVDRFLQEFEVESALHGKVWLHAHEEGKAWNRLGARQAGDPAVTHGKGGVPPLTAQPDPAIRRVEVGPSMEAVMFPNDVPFPRLSKKVNTETSAVSSPPAIPEVEPVPPQLPDVRRCEGWPGVWECDAVLGPEVPGKVCAHCLRNIEAAKAQDLSAEEAFIDCDGCQPERRPLSGKLCSRCRAERLRQIQAGKDAGAASGSVQTAVLRSLVVAGFFTDEQAAYVAARLCDVAGSIELNVRRMNDAQEAVFLGLVLDLVQDILASKRRVAKEALERAGAVRS